MDKYFIPPEWAGWSPLLIEWIAAVHAANLEEDLLPEALHLTARPAETDTRDTVTSGEITPGTVKTTVGDPRGLFS